MPVTALNTGTLLTKNSIIAVDTTISCSAYSGQCFKQNSSLNSNIYITSVTKIDAAKNDESNTIKDFKSCIVRIPITQLGENADNFMYEFCYGNTNDKTIYELSQTIATGINITDSHYKLLSIYNYLNNDKMLFYTDNDNLKTKLTNYITLDWYNKKKVEYNKVAMPETEEDPKIKNLNNILKLCDRGYNGTKDNDIKTAKKNF